MKMSTHDNRMMIALFILFMATASLASKSYPVTTLLNAKYNVTPVCLEIAEYLFDENPNLYWDYIENLNQLKTPLYDIGKIRLNGIIFVQLYRLIRLDLQIATQKATSLRFKQLRVYWDHCR